MSTDRFEVGEIAIVHPLPLFKVPGIYRYRCAECFERETGFAHHLSPANSPRIVTAVIPPLVSALLCLLLIGCASQQHQADVLAEELCGTKATHVIVCRVGRCAWADVPKCEAKAP